MGKTKTKLIDDSLPAVEEKKKPEPKKRTDDLVAKINADLGVNEEVKSRPEPARGLAKRESSGLPGGTDEGTFDERIPVKPELTEEKEVSSVPGPRAEKKQAKQPTKSKPRGKKYQEVSKDLDKSKIYPLNEAVDLVKKMSYSKFDGTLEAHINTAQTGVRGLVSLPYASGKKLIILAFGKGAEDSGADIFGSDEVIEEINKGKVNFDLVITTPEWMPKLAKVARILGPRGLMSNPKNGTITDDLKKAVASFQSGKTEYKTEAKGKVIHLGLGKLSQPTEELSTNIKTLLQTIGKTRIKKVALAPTMGPSVKLDLSNI